MCDRTERFSDRAFSQILQLGKSIDCKNKTAFVYRADGSVTQYPGSATLSGEDVVPGFTLAFKVFL